jgi:hypothetical protein
MLAGVRDTITRLPWLTGRLCRFGAIGAGTTLGYVALDHAAGLAAVRLALALATACAAAFQVAEPAALARLAFLGARFRPATLSAGRPAARTR